MFEMSNCIHIIVYLIVVLISYKIRVYLSVLWHNRNRNHKNIIKPTKHQKSETHLVLFAPTDDILTKARSPLKRWEESETLTKLVSIVRSTQESLDICVYNISLSAMVKACIDLHRSGVAIRVITNDFSSGNKANRNNLSTFYRLTNDRCDEKRQMKQMAKAGIQIRYFSEMRLGYMHHKFVVIDNRLFITGSLNWTGSVYHNYEDCLITSDRRLVRQYSKKFNEYWDTLMSDEDFQ